MKNNSTGQDAELDRQAVVDSSQIAIDNSLETVRDILFGAQVRESEKRTTELEALVKHTADKLQKKFDEQIHNLQQALAQLQKTFTQQAESTAVAVADRFQYIEELIAKLEAATKAAQHDLYEELSAERESLAQQAAGWNEDLARQLEQVQQQLQHSKTDRTTLAQLLQTMATSLVADEASGRDLQVNGSPQS